MFDAEKEAMALINSWRRAPMFDTELRDSLAAALRAAHAAGMERAAGIVQAYADVTEDERARRFAAFVLTDIRAASPDPAD